jgi:LmbE family N-acetylglucosaminyl deacetylase
MLALRLADLPRPFRLLCLGAHSDDIEIGCGGTVLRLAGQIPDLAVRWVVFSGNSARAAEARGSAADFLASVHHKTVEIKDFRDGFLPYQGAQVKDAFEALKRDFDPALVLTHYKHDAHQDHRLIAELTYNTFRNHLILEYEIPKHDGDFGNPNMFVPLSEHEARHKVTLLMRHFASQRSRHWFAEETFLSLLRLRGVFSGGPTGFAEGFYSRRAILA